jgi:hypothetical protein
MVDVHQEQVAAGGGINIDRAVEWNRHPRLQIEAVKAVQYRNIVTIRRPDRTIWDREIHPDAGKVRRVVDRVPIGGLLGWLKPNEAWTRDWVA